MTRDQIMKKYNCSYSDACIIEKIEKSSEFKKTCADAKHLPASGYVMPVYHGWDWKRTKTDLVKKYTYAKI